MPQLFKNKLYLVIALIWLSQSVCKANITPVRNLVDQQQAIVLIDDGGAEDNQEIGRGNAAIPGVAPFPFPLIIMVPMMAMMAMTMMETMSITAAQAATVPTAAAVTCSTPQPPPPTTPCVPSSCPVGYKLLDDPNVSPNCYMFSGSTEKKWCDALMTCTMTKGATLWIPNSEAEANAVRTTFSLPPVNNVWTGGNDLKDDIGNFVFAIDNSEFSFDNLLFGTGDPGARGANCVIIRYLTNPFAWRWNDRSCDEREPFVCELPRI